MNVGGLFADPLSCEHHTSTCQSDNYVQTHRHCSQFGLCGWLLCCSSLLCMGGYLFCSGVSEIFWVNKK